MALDQQDVLNLLNQIIDPCSAAAGLPAGLVDMGLVLEAKVLGLEGSQTIDVTLTITEPGCLMAAPFAERARDLLERTPGVETVRIAVNVDHMWNPDEMSTAYQSALHKKRASSRYSLPLSVTGPGVRPVP